MNMMSQTLGALNQSDFIRLSLETFHPFDPASIFVRVRVHVRVHVRVLATVLTTVLTTVLATVLASVPVPESVGLDFLCYLSFQKC